MKCEDCRYFYIEKKNDSMTVYNGLSDMIETITALADCRMCGVSPGGIFLDDNQPVCKDFERRS
jgi:rubredoxin